MSIFLAYIDHHSAKLEEREIFSFSREKTAEVYSRIMEEPVVNGAVLIMTCNRTEIYISASENCCTDENCSTGANRRQCGSFPPDPRMILCRAADIDPDSLDIECTYLQDEAAIRHLCRLAAGAESRLWGDTQIITQVCQAAEESRENDASDAVLNTVFRIGITAGKTIRTNIDMNVRDASTADCAVREVMDMCDRSGSPFKVLVIGNGMIGRLIAGKLAHRGLDVMMTLRRYRHSEGEIPKGVKAVPYDDRYVMMKDRDAVICATASPHYVVTRERLEQLDQIPKIFIDMAVPRDVEPEAAGMGGSVYRNIDDITAGSYHDMKDDQLLQIERYIDSFIDEFDRWDEFRRRKTDKVRRLSEAGRSADGNADPSRDPNRCGERRYFPAFIDSYGKKVVIAGGGIVAERRVMTLTEFGFDITIITEQAVDTLEKLADAGAIKMIRSRFKKEHLREYLQGADIVAACTNDRETNRLIGDYCRENGILVSVCDARSESTFWFPAVALNDELTIGIIGTGKRHDIVKRAATSIRKMIAEKIYR